MVSADEKRFLRYWQDQRTGGKLSYYLQYTLIGAFIISLFVFVTMFLLLNYYVTPFILIFVPASCVVASLLLTHYSWVKNEGRMKRIIKREVNQSKLADNSETTPSI